MSLVIDVLTFDWFLPKAFSGTFLGFFLRSLEHFAYYRREGSSEGTGRKALWLIMAGSQTAAIGIPLSYLLLGVLALNLPSEVFITSMGYLLPVMTAYVAVDLRELLRRYKG